MKPGAPRYKDLPLNIVGSTTFGRYPKMSSEETYNMFISDDWLIPFAGYQLVKLINNTGEGRGIYSSSVLQKLFAVIDNDVFIFDTSLSYTVIGRLDTFVGDVYITENNAGQVAFSDNLGIYIYDSRAVIPFSRVVIDFLPGYLTFQNGRFISPDRNTHEWRLSELNNGNSWPFVAQFVGELETKADNTVACLRFPGKGNLLLVFGATVTEFWYDVGAQLFPYQRSQSVNIDYGCINASTIASNENMVCWVAANEQSGPVIMFTDGGAIQRISNDGIDFRLAALKFPANCYAFFFRQDGHLLYVVSWPQDNVSYVYDFNTKRFFTLCDENMDVFIVKRVAFFSNEYYFVSLKDGNLYQLSSNFFSYNYGSEDNEIPRIRICKSVALPDQSNFVTGYCGFTMEQGQFLVVSGDTDNLPRVDLSVSKDGGVNFGSNVSINMRPQGQRQNRVMWWGLGIANDLTPQFRFWGYGRFVVRDGITGIYQ